MSKTDTLLEPQGAVPQALTLSGSAMFFTWRLRCIFNGNANGARDIFVLTKRVRATALRLDRPYRRPCAELVRLVRRATNNSSCSQKRFSQSQRVSANGLGAPLGQRLTKRLGSYGSNMAVCLRFRPSLSHHRSFDLFRKCNSLIPYAAI